VSDPDVDGANDHDAGLIGTVVNGRYEIVEHLGSGGMGSVFKARQIAMDRMVALKLLHAHYASNKQAVARFNREMQVTAKIEHPNTIRVYDFGQTEDGRIFLAMEFLEGHTLSKALSHGEPMGSERLVHIGVQIGKALAAAHSDGIVHRDLKPDNVMLLDRYGERDFVKVLDFGIARFMDDQSRTQLTAEGAVVGTPIYMSPEQATGGALDHRTDLYSFGVMLFEMATGRVPFDAPTTISLMVKHVQEDPPRPSDFAPGLVPEPIETLILQMLAKNPAARPTSANEVVRQLEAAIAPVGALAADTWVQTGLGETQEGDAVDASHTSTAQRPADVSTRPGSAREPAAPRSRLPFLLGVGGVVVAAIVAVVVVVAGGDSTPSPPPETRAGEVDAAIVAEADAGATDEADGASVAASPDAGARPRPDGGTMVAAGVDAGVMAAGPDATAEDDAAVVAEADTVAVDTEPPAPGSERRADLDRALETLGYALPPEECRSSDGEVEGAFIDAITLLDGGRVGSARDEDAKALALLEEVEGKARDVAEYWVLVAQARLYAGKPSSLVLEAASRAVAHCDDWAAAHNALGNAHMRLGENDLAVRAYRKASGIDPSYAAPRFNVGLIKLKQNDQEGAIDAFTEVIARSPDHPNARMLRGQAYIRLKQWERAVADLKGEADRDSTNPRAWLLLGQAQQGGGDEAAAHVAFCKAKELGAEEAAPFCTDTP